MKKNKKITVLGGDLRYLYTADYFRKLGYNCLHYGFDKLFLQEKTNKEVNNTKDIKALSLEDALSDTDYIVLPLPYKGADGNISMKLSDSSLSFDDFCSYVGKYAKKDVIIFCGRADDEIKSTKFRVRDYSIREDFAILNAYLTAEAAIEIILHELPQSLKETKTAVLGYGRIGKAMARLLHGFGTNFTVYARRSEIFAMLESCSYSYSDISQLIELNRYDLVINTVPKVILYKEQLSSMKSGSTILDLASLPGGVDLDAARYYGINTISARGLPGKCSPLSAGKIICDCINNIIYMEE